MSAVSESVMTVSAMSVSASAVSESAVGVSGKANIASKRTEQATKLLVLRNKTARMRKCVNILRPLSPHAC